MLDDNKEGRVQPFSQMISSLHLQKVFALKLFTNDFDDGDEWVESGNDASDVEGALEGKW